MVKLRPTHLCCGCVGLLVGVELICLMDLVWSVIIVAIVSSKERLFFFGLVIQPFWQVLAGALALIGIPVILGAGVGALYQIEPHLRYYAKYKWGCFFLGSWFFVQLVMDGKMCESTTSEQAQRLGSVFVCGFMDTFSVFWIAVWGLIYLYTIYIIWSAAEEVARLGNLEIVQYTKALRAVKLPEEPAPPVPVGTKPSRAFPYAAPAPTMPLYASTTTYASTTATPYTQQMYVEAPTPAPAIQQTYTYTTTESAPVVRQAAAPQTYASYNSAQLYTSAVQPVASYSASALPAVAQPPAYTYAAQPIASYSVASLPGTEAPPVYQAVTTIGSDNSPNLMRPIRTNQDGAARSVSSSPSRGRMVGVPSSAVPLDNPRSRDPSPMAQPALTGSGSALPAQGARFTRFGMPSPTLPTLGGSP